ncbi:MAG: hypothetical protein C0523_03675 [Cytophaga sp.]|nr:hypothetical protein [Cytophaga sp.]
MTLASYMLSKIRKKEFFEPKILNRLLYRIDAFQKRNPNHFAGWIIHYTMGLLASVIIWAIIESYINNLSVFIFMALGAITGIVGCLLWEALFQFHPYPPKMKFTEFYVQSFILHIVYGIGCWIAFLIYLRIQVSA